MSRSYNFVSHVEFNHVEEISKLLKEGANPDLSHAGVRPLHLAAELAHTDLVAYLIHWGASLTIPDGNSMGPLACAQRAQFNAKTDKQKWDETIKIIKDADYRKKYIEELIPRVNEMVRLKDIQHRENTRKAVVLIVLTVITSFLAIHFLVIVKPPGYERIISPKSEKIINDLSIVVKTMQRRYDMRQFEWARWGQAAVKAAGKGAKKNASPRGGVASKTLGGNLGEL